MPSTFERAMGRRPQRSAPFDLPTRLASRPLDAGALTHYWYPGRDGAEPCPTAFAQALTAIHPDLAIVRPPPGAPMPFHPWIVWYRKPAITTFYTLAELHQHRNVPWAGYEAIEDSIIRYLAWQDRSHEIERRGGPGLPSQYVWDDTGHAYRYAIGADSGEMVRTEILDSGDRRPFGVKLTLTAADALKADLSDVAPWIAAGQSAVKADKLEWKVIGQSGNVICPVCGKTESYHAEDRNQQSAARSRMARHLKTAKQEVNRHRILYTKEFK